MDFVEVISENFMLKGGKPLNVLAAVRERYAVALHGVSMSIGFRLMESRSWDYYLRRLKAPADQVQPLWVSDHLCWTGLEGFNSHDLICSPNLLTLQRNMREHLIKGSEDIGREIRGDPSARLAVYHHAYRAQLMDCLRIRSSECGLGW